MPRPRRPLKLAAPYLRRIWLDPARIPAGGRETYPFGLPLFPDDFELSFETPVTIIVGENGSGKSTLLEAIAVLVGFDEAGGGAGYRPVDHADAIEATGGQLAQALRASWLPRLNAGWFFKAESFFSVARYLDVVARGAGPPPDFLSHSHGEGFLRFFAERCGRQGIYIFDEPESALSPARQIDFLKLLGRMNRSGVAQVILATHSPILMAYPGATLLAATPRGFVPTTLEQTSHYRLMRDFAGDPHGFVTRALEDGGGLTVPKSPRFVGACVSHRATCNGTIWMYRVRHFAFAVLLPIVAVASVARAQDYDRPPAGFQDDGRDDRPYRGSAVDAPDPGASAVRIGKLESRIREMTGQIEELQNANRKLTDQMQKFQADVDTRLQDRGSSRPKRSDALPGENGPAMDAPASAVPSKIARGDAFDPGASPTAPGVPKPLGASTSATPPADAAPMDLSGGTLRRGSNAIEPTTTPRVVGGGTVSPNGTIIADGAPNSPKEEFDLALGYYKDKQYESAEKGFTAFIAKNPKNRLVADATFYIGETYGQRGRQREAAEQYLKISTDYANSARAPEAMLRLGVSLKALGAKEQACATFSEVGRKYPNAPAYVKTGADREAKRAQCSAG